MEMDIHQGISKGLAMKPKPYARFIDFVIVLVSLDILHALLTVVLWMTFGPDKEDPVITTVTPILSVVLFWAKLGLAVLFWKRVPFRPDYVDASLAFRKLWTMAFFWPLLLTK